MKFGLSIPNKGIYSDIHLVVELAQMAEEANWDGFYLWDHVAGPARTPFVDPWICLAAIAVQTRKMRLGALVTPLSRRRPWKVAREIVALDRLSEGRMVLGVGLGYFKNKEFKEFGEVDDSKIRGDMLDEGLEILAGLQSGEKFSYEGEH
jgi:alkanesulfonate monooxygenase SsuD/methylene tetrahydromethanopterin reductase-like flavin-dependent oxidoreductase (luciferase family)